ncbi:thiosulfate oxidation carrier complex protein SoxZ [Bradyrhizobium sp. WSM2793]|uniref:thiosulfate oxidation carrier complex protein SoxZ n=1 Tax=Bradyrhizobium sp. WSM2793 TaxID=1038866 RepID=UPI00036C9C48|nr:thiosulfate oxidation carrier complex protein SoxZ [Bradyrhizobium sp. WSM2793]
MTEKPPRIKLPKEARKGEVIQIKTLVAHVMENGLRLDQSGGLVPRKIINRFTCTFNGKPVFACDLEPAVAANPYLQFSVKIDQSGVFSFTWVDDDGTTINASETIAVT